MYYEDTVFEADTGPPPDLDKGIFQYCTWERLDIQGPHIGGALLCSTLRRVEWYWGFCNVASFVKTNFEDCVFRGSSFMGGTFVQCRFERCRFLLDNLGSACTWHDCSLTECHFDRCIWEADPRPGRRLVENTRFYACTHTNSPGFEHLF